MGALETRLAVLEDMEAWQRTHGPLRVGRARRFADTEAYPRAS